MDNISATDLHGRTGTFSLPREDVITPNLVPVVDPKNNLIPPQEMKDKFNFNLLITSAYLYLKRYGKPDGTKLIHETLNFDGNVMMDSGAYQILAYGDVDIEPLDTLDIQSTLKTDIGVILDVPTPPADSYEVAKQKIYDTIDRIKLSLDHIKNHTETIWTLPIQGGKNVDLIELYLENVKTKNYLEHFGFHALGSVVPIMTNYEYTTLFSMIYTARKNLPHSIPLHIFGAGHPMIFPFITALGADTFDSAAYILFAKDDRYMTEMGTEHLSDLGEFPCNCKICNQWKPKELLKIEKNERIKQLAYHNLHVSASEIRKTREAINEGRLWEVLEQRAFAHPALYKAFKYMMKGIDSKFLDFGTPIAKSGGLKIYNADSFDRPELAKARKRIEENFTPQSQNLKIYLFSGEKSPMAIFSYKKHIVKSMDKEITESDVALFLPFIGLIPIGLMETYPFSQFVFSGVMSESILAKAANEVANYIKKFGYKNIVIKNEDIEIISDRIIERITSTIKQKNKGVSIRLM